MKLATVMILVILVLAGTAVWFVYSGTYNIATSKPHTAFGNWLLTTVKTQSIERHANGIDPPDLTQTEMIQTGAEHYTGSCAICHGAPGQELSEISKGLNPAPPELHTGEVQRKYSDAEIYWIIEHGIRMTGMPAFGPTHKAEDLWSIVGFVKQLPNLRAEEYTAMVKKSQDHHSSGAAHHSGS